MNSLKQLHDSSFFLIYRFAMCTNIMTEFAIAIILGVTASLISLSASAIGCATIDTTNVLSIYGCIAGPIASGMIVSP